MPYEKQLPIDTVTSEESEPPFIQDGSRKHPGVIITLHSKRIVPETSSHGYATALICQNDIPGMDPSQFMPRSGYPLKLSSGIHTNHREWGGYLPTRTRGTGLNSSSSRKAARSRDFLFEQDGKKPPSYDLMVPERSRNPRHLQEVQILMGHYRVMGVISSTHGMTVNVIFQRTLLVLGLHVSRTN
ncbi:MAG: hypothetical protein JXR55_10095 [Candidatus Fermentibacteraceae bacterium]|nr:hypothetical protein [Candidatus Fermentibacteraceae bacterium]